MLEELIRRANDGERRVLYPTILGGGRGLRLAGWLCERVKRGKGR